MPAALFSAPYPETAMNAAVFRNMSPCQQLHGGLGDLGDQGNQHIGHSVSAAQERECNWWRGLQVTYPLDTLRLRLAVDPAARSISGTARALMREGSHGAFSEASAHP